MLLLCAKLPNLHTTCRWKNLKCHPFHFFPLSGKIEAVTSFKALKENGSISEDVMLLFDEMYLQKCEEYTLAVKL